MKKLLKKLYLEFWVPTCVLSVTMGFLLLPIMFLMDNYVFLEPLSLAFQVMDKES